MKFFAPVVLAFAAAAPLVAADIVDTCYIDPSGNVLEDEVLVTLHDVVDASISNWYGYNVGTTFAANTPNNIEGEENANKMGFIPVQINDGGVDKIGLALILDTVDPNHDTDGGTLVTKVTCEPESGIPTDCGSFPELTFLEVKDDGPPNPTDDKYAKVGNALYVGHRWNADKTDGFATELLEACVEICVEVLDSAVSGSIPDGILSGRRSSPSGLDGAKAYSQTHSMDTSMVTLKGSAPVNGDKFCFKTCGGSTGGDPHFKTFGAKWYDFMGACDLVLLDAPKFTPEAGLRVDIRTAIRYAYSYIESAVIALGEDIFEVSSFGQYAINGVSNAELPATLNGFSITHTQPSDKIHVFQVSFSEHEHLTIKTLKDMVSVKWGMILGDRFEGARGMLGDAENGKMLGRNGTVTFEDPNEFAAEWQVREDEAMNFMVSRAPQHPAQCVMPEVNAAAQRRLGETATIEAAEKACANWAPEMRAACVHDVIATGDLELAEAGAF